MGLQKGMSQVALPLSAVIGGVMVDQVFEPLMEETGMVGSVLGNYLGTGHGRGVGLMFIVFGTLNIIATTLAFMYKPLRCIDTSLSDQI